MNETTESPRPQTLAEIGCAGDCEGSRPGAVAGSSAAAGAFTADGSGAAAGSTSGRNRLLSALSTSDERLDAWHSTWQWPVAAVLTLLLAWLTYTREGWVPILSSFDLGVHEFGHLLTMWAPDLVVWPAGSFLQVAAPLALGVYFLYRRDRFAVVLMVAWAAESLHNVSVYVGDAQAMVLPLFGDDGSGAGHDWHNILGRLDLLESTDTLARVFQLGSVLLFVAALGLSLRWLVRARRVD